MYILADKPKKSGTLSDAFDAIDEAFGTGEFSEDQAVSAIALGLSVPNERATQLLKDLVQQEFVTEVD
jgi:hypothetical protein